MTRYGMRYDSIRYWQRQARELMRYNGIVAGVAYFRVMPADDKLASIACASVKDLAHAAIQMAVHLSPEQVRNMLVYGEKDGPTIRPYGPGKFNTLLDAYVYEVSLGGCTDDECGDSGYGSGWYGLMRHGHSIFKDNDPCCESLNDAERAQLSGCAGVIISEGSDGFVYVQYFDTQAELDTTWDRITAEHDADEDADGDEDHDNN